MPRPIDAERLKTFIDENIRYVTTADLPNIKAGDIDGLIKCFDTQHVNPFDSRTRKDIDNPHRFLLRLMRNPDYFPFTCEYVFNTKIFPFQHAILKELWTKPFPMLIAGRGASKSFTLGLYAMIRALLCQGCKIVIVGAAFRQAKVVFEYCEKFWANAPVLRDLCGTGKGFANRDQGPRRDVDRCEMIIGDSVITALPLGDGGKIRGQRANYILADEFSSIPLSIFETVVRGFGSVNQDPVMAAEREMRVAVLKRLGYWSEEQEEDYKKGYSGNQCVVAGTADYGFMHFAKYWKRYKTIIESRGERRKVADIFGGDDKIDPSFNWRDYSVIRIPADALPVGLMDAKQLAAAKATVTKAVYMMEYGACLLPNTKVITDRGVKPIQTVQAGDMVLTHAGRFSKVVKLMTRHYDGNVIKYKTFGCGESVTTTIDHPYWLGNDEWGRPETIDKTYLVNLKTLNGSQTVRLKDVLTRYAEWKDLIYARPSKSRFTNEQVSQICASGDSQTVIAKRYGVRPTTIHNLLRRKKPTKGLIPAVLPLNVDLGVIVGYYASEGSIGADGRAAGFALDGHKTTKLKFYVNQLVAAIERTFVLSPKQYRKKKNTVEVTINNRLVADFLKYVCPGVSHTKYVRPEILYSNPEFLKGFVIGYWNGDGHLPKLNSKTNVAGGCTNQSLLSQFRVALSYFGVSATLSGSRKTNGFAGASRQLVYSLAMNGENARKFRQVFYKQASLLPARLVPSKISNDGNKTVMQFRRKSRETYRGQVFNLEVADDNSYSLLNATVHNCFVEDSDGFYRRTLIERCVTGKPDSDLGIQFNVALKGDKGTVHVMAVDPASESDNCTISIIAMHGNHRRIVYCWSTNKKAHMEQLKHKIIKEQNFFAFVARKMRDLMTAFPCERIVVDSQGGGFSVRESLVDTDKLRLGEEPIYEVIDPDDPKETDGKKGKHILLMVNFADANWVGEANHGLKKDFEDQNLLFPCFNPALLELSAIDDRESGRVIVQDSKEIKLYDTLEDAVFEIEELKTELTTIVHTKTPNGRDRWDTPEVKSEGQRKGRLRKDRYSALLMANMVSRQIHRTAKPDDYKGHGGFANTVSQPKGSGQMYIGANSEWFHSGGYGGGGLIVRRAV